jgi:dTDP-4-dehydrorhamnose reductase
MKNEKIKVLILGATGLIGSGLFYSHSNKESLEVFGTIRSQSLSELFPKKLKKNLFSGVDVTNDSVVLKLISRIQPHVVINCIGLTKHLPSGNDPLLAIPLNSYLPHYLAAHCKLLGIRFIHISSDCVFSGNKGNYVETDIPDATDIYGKSKALGEIDDGSAVTLRTSTIGHELTSSHGLLNWFLSQKQECPGFKKALFSGVSTVELARIISDFVIPTPLLTGLYHIAGQTISKYDLLKLIAKEYGKQIHISPEKSFEINRSLNGDKFLKATGYTPPSWPKLIKMMHQSHQGYKDVQ